MTFVANRSSYFSLSEGSAPIMVAAFSEHNMISVTLGNKSSSKSPQYSGLRRLYRSDMAFLQASVDGGGSAGPGKLVVSLGFADGSGYLSLSWAIYSMRYLIILWRPTAGISYSLRSPGGGCLGAGGDDIGWSPPASSFR